MPSLLRSTAAWFACALVLALLACRSGRAYGPTPSTQRLANTVDGGPAVAWASSSGPVMSADGRYVAFFSNATNLAGATGGVRQVCLRDRATGGAELVSQSTAGAPANGDCYALSTSSDGRFLVFTSFATNLLDGADAGNSQVYLRDRLSGTTELVSRSLGGGPSNNIAAYYTGVSADGRFVAFVSFASDLVAGDTNGYGDVFVRDRQLGATQRVSVGAGGAEGNSDSGVYGMALSADGRSVAYISQASNLVGADTNDSMDLFVTDRISGVTERVSLTEGGAQANGDARQPAISGDGRYVAFLSFASNMLGEETPSSGVYVRDRLLQSTQLASVAGDGSPMSANLGAPAISADGSRVAFTSDAATGDNSGSLRYDHVYLRNLGQQTTERVTAPVPGLDPGVEGIVQAVAVSADGRYVAFDSDAANLVTGDSNGQPDVFVRDRQQGTTERDSVAAGGDQGTTGAVSGSAVMTSDGRYVAFVSDAMNLVPGDGNAAADVFLIDRQLGTIERVDVSSTGDEARPDGYPAPVTTPAISPDGRYVVFCMAATNLAPGAVPGLSSIFLRDRQLGTTEVAGIDSAGRAVSADELTSPGISADGRYVSFVTSAAATPEDTNGYGDVFVRDRVAQTTERVSVATNGAQADYFLDESTPPQISSDGRYVLFSSFSSALDGDGAGPGGVFLRDRQTHVTERISSGLEGARIFGYGARMSVDARYVAYVSGFSNVVAGDTNGWSDIFVYDRQSKTTRRVDVSSTGGEASGGAEWAGISADGRFVTYLSQSPDLLAGQTYPTPAVLVYDRQSGSTQLASVPADGQPGGPAGSAVPAVSANGRYVLFQGDRGFLGVAGDAAQDLYLRDRWGVDGPPAAPSALTATPDDTGVRLQWTDVAPDRNSFRIERRSGGGPFMVLSQVSGEQTTFEDTTAQPATAYGYRVTALNPVGASSPTSETLVTTWPAPTGKLTAPKRVEFGTALAGFGAGRTKSVLLRNASRSSRLQVTVALVGNGYQIVSGAGTTYLPPGGSAGVQVQFAPNHRGAVTATLAVTSSDPHKPTARVVLSGHGK